jgi:hypothetical protein
VHFTVTRHAPLVAVIRRTVLHTAGFPRAASLQVSTLERAVITKHRDAGGPGRPFVVQEADGWRIGR